MADSMNLNVRVGAAVDNSFKRTLTAAGQQAERLGQQWESTNKKLRAAGDVIKYKNLLGELREKQTTLGRSSERMERGIEDVERRYRAAKRSAKSYGIEIGQVAQAHKRLGLELQRTERQQRALQGRQAAGARLRGIAGLVAGATGAVYGAGRLVSGAAQREEQALYLRTVINAPDRDAAVGRAVEAARAFARQSLASEQEVLEIEYALNSAGLQEETARAGTQLVHRIAKVTRGVPEQVGEIFGVTFNNMAEGMTGSAVEKMKRIGNVLAKTQFKFQIRDFGQLGESLKHAGDDAVRAKVSLEQTAAAVGILNTAGLQGSMAGTAFGAVLRNLGKAARELGFDRVRDEAGQLDLIATLEGLQQRVADLGTDERGDLLQELFGDEGAAGITPLLNLLDQLKAGHAELAEAAGSNLVDEEYERFLRSSAGQWLMFRQNVAQAGDAFGQSLLPSLNFAVGHLARLAGWVAEGINRFPVLGQAIGVVGGAVATFAGLLAALAIRSWLANAAVVHLGPTFYRLRDAAGAAVLRLKAFNLAALVTGVRTRALVVGGAISSFGAGLLNFARNPVPAAVQGLGTLRVGLMGAMTAMRVFAIALLTSPVGWIAAAIGAAAVLLIRYWQPVKAFFGGIWSGFVEGLGPVGSAIGKVIEWVGGLLKPLGFATEDLAGFANAGKIVGKVIGGAFRIVFTVIGLVGKAVAKALGWLGLLDGEEDKRSVPQAGATAARRTAGAAATAAGVALAAPAFAQPPVSVPEPAIAPPAATFPAPGESPVNVAPAASFPAAGEFSVNLAPAVVFPAVEEPIERGPLPFRVAPSRTVNQTVAVGPIEIQIQMPPGSDAGELSGEIAAEIEARLTEVLRQADADAASAEDDGS